MARRWRTAVSGFIAAVTGLGLAVAPDNEALLYTHTEDTQSDLALIGELVAR